jgi:hypothetical protein
MADLVEDVLNDPLKFSLLLNVKSHIAFFKGLAIGLRQRANPHMAGSVNLAPDYGRWMLAAWQQIRSNNGSPMETSAVVLFALGLIARTEAAAPSELSPWWKSLVPLIKAVMSHGCRADCHMVMIQLVDAQLLNIASAKDIIAAIADWAHRIAAIVTAKPEEIDFRDHDQGESNSWRDCAAKAAEIAWALESAQMLVSDSDREEAYQLLSFLASVPFGRTLKGSRVDS